MEIDCCNLLQIQFLEPHFKIYILFDIYITFQDFPSQIVHIAVNCVDQYLMRRKVQRSELQLLGITCMLIAARFVLAIILLLRVIIVFFIQGHPRSMCVFVWGGVGGLTF